MHRGLPVVAFIELVSVGSSELEFGTSINSIMFGLDFGSILVWFLDEFVRSVD